jgi:hypothetical protein
VWLAVKEHGIAARLEQSTIDIENAADQLELSRAREAARIWMWRAEREHARWAAKPQTAVNIAGSEGAVIQIVSYAHNNTLDSPSDAASIIDAEPVQDSDSV